MIEVPEGLEGYVAQKGSICLDGVSLTVNEVEDRRFGVNLIPHTWDNTTKTLGYLTGDKAAHEHSWVQPALERALGGLTVSSFGVAMDTVRSSIQRLWLLDHVRPRVGYSVWLGINDLTTNALASHTIWEYETLLAYMRERLPPGGTITVTSEGLKTDMPVPALSRPIAALCDGGHSLAEIHAAIQAKRADLDYNAFMRQFDELYRVMNAINRMVLRLPV